MNTNENPFIFGEIIDDENFVNRTVELRQLVRDLADGQKVFLLLPAALRQKLAGGYGAASN